MVIASPPRAPSIEDVHLAAAIGLADLAADTLDAAPPPAAVTEARRYTARIAETLQRWDLTATSAAAILNPPGPAFPEGLDL